MPILFNNSWDDILIEELNKEYFQQLMEKLEKERKNFIIFPKEEDIFNALKMVSYEQAKVVIIGQDPYHGENQAHGYSFSVQKGIKIPPSLRNIYKELGNDLGIQTPEHGNLENWARQGVLLLNSSLTVRKGEANSHRNLGWEIFTDTIIEKLGEREDPMVFILWGNHARNKKKFIRNKNHLILESVHPSPLSASRGFFGTKPFSKTNEFLVSLGKKPISWSIK